MSVEGKTVLISAGGSGIGRAIADAFDRAGARVWVSDIDVEALASCPKSWKTTVLDVTNEDLVANLYEKLAEDFGSLDVLCANAGTAGPTASIENIDLADWQRCVAVNLEGAFLFSKYAIPMMKKARSGVILLTSSTGGIYGFPNRAPYCSAKWAINGLMKTLAMELGPFGIRANSICPGSVEGPRIERVMEKEAAIKGTTRDAIYEGYSMGTSMRTFVTAEDIANLAVFLASSGGRHISGQIIPVDGHTENQDPKV